MNQPNARPRRDISQPHKFEAFDSVPSMCCVYDSVRAETCSLAASNEIHKVGAAGKDPATVPTEEHNEEKLNE